MDAQTLKSITEILAERAGKEFDEVFQLQLEDIVIGWRARLAKNSISKDPSARSLYEQFITMDLKKVPFDECLDLEDVDVCDTVLRTVNKVPQTLVTSTLSYSYVGSATGLNPIGFTEMHNLQYLAHAKYTSKATKYAVKNNYLYIMNTLDMDKIGVRDVFYDPRQLSSFKCNDGSTSCYDPNNDLFPMDGAMFQPLITGITEELKFNAPEDEVEIKAEENV